MNPDASVHHESMPSRPRWKASLGGPEYRAVWSWPGGAGNISWDNRRASNGTEGVYGGRKVLLMCTDDCLGMASHPRVREASVCAVERYGTGCAGSRFLNGTLALHEDLERRLAALLNREMAVLFPSGYQANIGAIAALVAKDDFVVFDEHCDPAVIDGGKLAIGRALTSRSRTGSSLNGVLNDTRGRNCLVVVDGVLQPENVRTDLPSILRCCRSQGAGLMVNDAYGIGIMGENGAGTPASFGMDRDVDLITGSFSKALGAAGGFAAGDAVVIEYLKHHARSLIFSASVAPPNAAAALAALEVLTQEPERRLQLKANAEYFSRALRQMGHHVGGAEGAAVPICFHSEQQSRRTWNGLLEAGVLTAHWPGHAHGQAEGFIKVCLSSNHSRAQLNYALDVLSKIIPR